MSQICPQSTFPMNCHYPSFEKNGDGIAFPQILGELPVQHEWSRKARLSCHLGLGATANSPQERGDPQPGEKVQPGLHAADSLQGGGPGEAVRGVPPWERVSRGRWKVNKE